MSQIIDQAEELRKQAVALLLHERQTINEKLQQLGHNGEPLQTKEPKLKACRRCGQAGHTVRTCPTPLDKPE
jgi:hypothetical protein